MKRALLPFFFALFIASCQSLKPSGDEAPPSIDLPPGFVYEHLYSPSANDQGTWVALAFDDVGRLYASDQHGYLYRLTLPAIEEEDGIRIVERVTLEIGKANGLLWAFGGLYVAVNSMEGMGEHHSGIYKLTDTTGRGQLDHIELLHRFEGATEHGPHSLRLSPDGSQIYFIAGNHTDLPETYTSRHPEMWDEDNLLPAIVDPRGHANDRMAPGGWIARMNPDGSDFEVVSIGYRNPYDIAFNRAGELFTFDADMEWDLGMPWYRPIRVNHVTSASEYGWRTGSGKWPAYYPDNLPAVVDIGQGSPTSILMGHGGNFPTRYQDGLFISDWSFGTMYWVKMEDEGSSYTGTFEEFLSGVPLPLTDNVWGPDGAMYLATGGRNLVSHLYRVYFTGDASTAAPAVPQANPLREQRRMLEAFHGTEHSKAVQTAWPYLNHPDRFMRYAARLAIESQPVERWAESVYAEADPIRRLHGVIALARHGGASHQVGALQALVNLPFAKLTEAQQLDALRAYSLVFIRLGAPSDLWRAKIVEQIGPHFPADSYDMNRELGLVLAYLEAPEVAGQLLALLEAETTKQGDVPILEDAITARHERYGGDIENMKANMPSAPEIQYALTLSHVKTGWTQDLRERYFQWFYDSMGKSGGRSYVGFIDKIRTTAIANVPAAEQEALAHLIVEFNQAVDFASLPQPEGPGEAWTQHMVRELINDNEDAGPRDFTQGQKMYEAALCGACHAMKGMGGNIGPDLSQVGTRFSEGDVVEAIISPSDAISDQYEATLFTRQDGTSIAGRVLERREDAIILSLNPYDPSQTMSIDPDDVVSEQPSPASLMPAGLLNRLNGEEILDLMAYLMAGADPEHERFTGQSSSE